MKIRKLITDNTEPRAIADDIDITQLKQARSHSFSLICKTFCSLISISLTQLLGTVLVKAPYLMLCICNISGSVALSEATKLPTGMFSILVTVRGSGKKTGPSLKSRTVTSTVAVELGP